MDGEIKKIAFEFLELELETLLENIDFFQVFNVNFSALLIFSTQYIKSVAELQLKFNLKCPFHKKAQ